MRRYNHCTSMQADFAVEIGGDAPALELPWASDDGALRFLDLHARPELLLEIEEARRFRELGEFLATVNTPGSALATAKCDVWATHELTEEEATFGASLKLASYVDLVFTHAARASFAHHEEFARALCGLLAKAPEIPSAAEFVIRRCYFHSPFADGPRPPSAGKTQPAASRHNDSEDGYCITFYLSSYADDEADARQRWTIGLKLVQNAILQIGSRFAAAP
jgi:hypothetical protein